MVQLKPFRADILWVRQRGSFQRALAKTPVEAREITARQHGPEHASAVDIRAARAEARLRVFRVLVRELVKFRELRLWVKPGNSARESRHAAPDRAVCRIWTHAIETENHPFVLGLIIRLTRFSPLVAFAITVGIKHEGSPTLACFFVVRRIPFLDVDPSDHVVIAAG